MSKRSGPIMEADSSEIISGNPEGDWVRKPSLQQHTNLVLRERLKVIVVMILKEK